MSSVTEEGTAAAVSAINACYTDTGIFGVFVIAPGNSAGRFVEKAVKVLKSINVSDKDVERAKKQLKLATLVDMENSYKCATTIGYQALLTTDALSPLEMCAEIDSINTGDVKQVKF